MKLPVTQIVAKDDQERMVIQQGVNLPITLDELTEIQNGKLIVIITVGKSEDFVVYRARTVAAL